MFSDEPNRYKDVAISLIDVGKQFHIYDKPHYRLLQSLYRGRKSFYKEFNALSGISFDISKGETVGIIGRNGAGKSTLLQIICGTMSQTTGDVVVDGRMAALLELGAGFNPEFTGRENVFMYASVLGLSRREIEERFEDIANFAGIGEFLELPVKTYSSGMYVRLAFSVVIHVNPEILIVDEALAVGDALFQAKCMVAMKKLIESGVTLLFVSHDVSAVKALCKRAILIEKGEIAALGETGFVVDEYYKKIVNEQEKESSEEEQVIPGTIAQFNLSKDIVGVSRDQIAQFQKSAAYQRIKKGKAEFLNVIILNEQGEEIDCCEFGEKVTLRMILRIVRDIETLALAYVVRDKNGFDIIYSDTGIESKMIENSKAGQVYLFEWGFNVMLKEGDYVIAAMSSIPIDLSIADVDVCDFVPIATHLKVTRGDTFPMHGAVYWDNDITCQLLDVHY